MMKEPIPPSTRSPERFPLTEAQWRAVFDSRTYNLILIDREGRILAFNEGAGEAARQVQGVEYHVGMDFFSKVAEESRPFVKARHDRVLAGESLRFEMSYPGVDGVEHWYDIQYDPLRDENGAITGVCLANVCIDERKKAESDLRLSEGTLRAVFNSGSQVTVLIGRDGKILKYNKTAEMMAPRILGRELKPGMPFLETLPPGADPENFSRSFKEALEGRETKGEREIRAQGGRSRWVEVNYQPVFNEERKVDGVCFSLTFIDERKNAEAALKESEERYRKLVEFSPEAVVVHSEGRIQYLNPTALRTFGVERPEVLLGRSILDFIHPDYRELMIGRVRKIVESGEPTEWIEAKLVAPDGRVFDTETKGTPFLFQGRPSVLTLVRDITERKKNQGTLLRYERLATIGKVIAGIAHDIRNPLAVLSSMTQSLKERFKPTEPNSREVEAILAQTERLKRFMSDILDYSRGLNLNREPVDVKRLLEQSLRWVQAQVGPNHERVEVQWGLDPALPPLAADTERLEQVLVNLLLNAYQAMEEGGTLTLASEANYGWLALKIKDTGHGIPEADLAHLFEPFFTTKKHGSGLGLSLSQKVVEAHGGKIEVQRVSPHGTLFTILLPLSRKD